jgi:hypothetical protein
MHQQMIRRRRPKINSCTAGASVLCLPEERCEVGDGNTNATVGRETVHQPTIGRYSLHDSTNENGLRLIDFASGRQMAIKSTYFMHKRIHLETWHSPDGRTRNQIDQCLIDGRHFSDNFNLIYWVNRAQSPTDNSSKITNTKKICIGRT